MILSNPLSLSTHKKIYILLAVVTIFEILLLLPVFRDISITSFATYFVLVALPLCFMILSIRDIHLGILALILSIPFLNMILKRTAITVGLIAVSPFSIMMWVIFVFFTLSSIIKNQNIKRFFYSSSDKLLILFAVTAFSSLLSSYYIGTPFERSILVYVTSIVEPVLFYLLFRRILLDEKRIDLTLFTIVLSLAIGLAMGFFLMLTRQQNLLLFLTERGGSRGFGFRGTNLFGIAAVLVFPLILLFTRRSTSKIRRLISYGTIIMIFVAIVTSFTRGLQITFLIEFFILLFFYRSGRKSLYPVLVLMVTAVLIFRERLLFLLVRFLTSGPLTPLSSEAGRIEAWKVSLIALVKYPFGLGGGNFHHVWQQFKATSIVRALPLEASHNIFLSIGTEFGILAMLLFLIFLFMQFRMCWWIFKNSQKRLYRDIALIIGISYIGYCIYGLTTGCELSHLSRYDPATTINSFTIILFTLFAVITSIFVKERRLHHG